MCDALHSSIPGSTYLGAVMHMPVSAGMSIWVCMCIGLAYVYANERICMGVYRFM